ncbi:extracellular solute-binding protein [Fimbriimonas ginsengisoli]|uniref:Sugar ABC transporter substrate-binding protein n=1 Tax=Fimbriimonas ginsengisoli Gsoil 348 TaxID=661478 RepID=A0A068NWN8_FIMGI|nr:extracellular solute-binding protein [Fimbriimonas ginsengisoli]AIE86004.1 sugar ABC transporter substrate-binding protein [Fimbriimonas ginsengisoli Gsoil 348]
MEINVPKIAKAGMAALFLLGGLAFLAPGDPSERHYPQRIPVTFWHTFAGEWQPIFEGMVDRFNASQTKYEVVPVSVPEDACSMKFLLSASGGDTPDLLMTWAPILGTWSDKRLIQPYDGIMTPAEKREFLARTYPIVKRHSTYAGKIMALVDGLDLYAMYYRPDHLKEIGVDKAHLPKTLEELVAMGVKLDRYDAQHHLRRVGYLPKTFSNYVPVFGGKFNEGGRIVVDTPENLRAMEFIAENTKRLGYDNATRFASSLAADAGPTMPLIAGNYSMMFDGEWRVKQVEQYSPGLPYLLAPIPPPKGGKANACMSSPNYLVIPTAAKQPQGAWEFAKFCVGFLHPEEGGRNMGDMGWLPDDPVIAKSSSYLAYLKRYPQYKVFVDLMTSPNLEIPPQGPMQNFVMDELSKAEDAVTRGSQTPAESLRLVQKHLTEEEARLRRLGQIRGGDRP